MSQLFFQTDRPNIAGKYFVSFIPIINITLILGWNSLAISNLLYFNIQLSRHLTYIVSEAVIRSVQVDILTTNFKLLSCVYHAIHWFSNLFRKKPPWLLIRNTYSAYLKITRGTYGFFLISEIHIITFPFFPSILVYGYLNFQYGSYNTVNLDHKFWFSRFYNSKEYRIMADITDPAVKKLKTSVSSASATHNASTNNFSSIDIDDLDVLKSQFYKIQNISTNYPEYSTLTSVFMQQSSFITEDTMRAFYHKYVQHLRIPLPQLPEALVHVIDEICETGIREQSSRRWIKSSVLHILALAWAAVKTISLRQRKELLDLELTTISSKVHTCTMPSNKVTKVQHALQQIYFAQYSAVDTAIIELQQETLRLLPTDAHSRATSSVSVAGADAAQHIPQILHAQLKVMTRGEDVARSIPHSDTATAWSTTPGKSSDFPPLPTPSASSGTWHFESKAISRPTAPPVKMSTVVLPQPIRADPPTLERITDAAKAAFSSRTELDPGSHSLIPESYSQVERSVQFDEFVIITRFLWVVGLTPCTSLGSETLNRQYTIAEHKHVVRMLGTLSDYLQNPAFSSDIA